jgi:transcription initiation factor TFIIIB Brf1 subunit/transcription initiation factor TFIIB
MSDGGEPESQRSQEEHLKKAFSEMSRVGSELGFATSVIEFSETMYRQVLKSRDKQYWDIEVTAMAVLYVAAKTQGEPINPEEIVGADRVNTTKKRLLRRAKQISNLLSLEIEAFYDSSSYIDRYCEELGVSEKVHERAHEITELCSEAGIAGGKNPGGWAASAIYLAATEYDEKIKQSEIADAANVTTVTIRNRYQEQRDTVREMESLPSDPYALVDWYSNRVGVSDKMRERAHDILKCGEEKSHPVFESPAWAAAALRRASEEFGNAVNKKALKEPIAVDSEDINSKITDLKKALRSSTEYSYMPDTR